MFLILTMPLSLNYTNAVKQRLPERENNFSFDYMHETDTKIIFAQCLDKWKLQFTEEGVHPSPQV
jgi:hypothetical protein